MQPPAVDICRKSFIITAKVYDTRDGSVLCAAIVDTNGHGHSALADLLQKLQADVLICGGIGGCARSALAAANIQLCGGVSGDADEAVEAYLAGELVFNPNARCSHHGEGHSCGSHDCGHH